MADLPACGVSGGSHSGVGIVQLSAGMPAECHGTHAGKIMGRAPDIGVRRALGANRGAIFAQCLIEAAVVGFAGGLLGLALTGLGLFGLRALLSEEASRLTDLSFSNIAIAVLVSVISTMLAGLYPTWRAAHVQPAWQLKAQ